MVKFVEDTYNDSAKLHCGRQRPKINNHKQSQNN